jgi:hypothetical protein
MKQFVKENKFEIIVIMIGFLLYCWFCNDYMCELPHLSWFDFFYLIEEDAADTLGFKDLFTKYSEHGMFGYNILFLINVKLFHLTTFFDVYLNDILVLITGIVSVKSVKKIANDNILIYRTAVVLITFINFSFIQLSSGAMETQVRLGIFLFFITAVYTDRYLQNEFEIYSTIRLVLLIIFSINIFGTMYSFAGIPMIFLMGIYNIRKKKNRKGVITVYSAYLAAAVGYVVEYGIISSGEKLGSEGGILKGILNLFSDFKETVLSILGYNGVSLLGSAGYYDGNVSNKVYIILGIMVSVVWIIGIVYYFKTRMYEVTYLPGFLMGYTFCVLIITRIGRGFEWDWFLNEWYIVHTKFGLIGCIFILCYVLKDKDNISVLMKRLVLFLGVCSVIAAIYGEILCIKREPNVKQYYLAKQEYLFVDSENMPVDENGQTPLLASADVTEKSINILKEQGLSVYRFYPVYKKSLEILNQSIKGIF